MDLNASPVAQRIARWPVEKWVPFLIFGGLAGQLACTAWGVWLASGHPMQGAPLPWYSQSQVWGGLFLLPLGLGSLWRSNQLRVKTRSVLNDLFRHNKDALIPAMVKSSSAERGIHFAWLIAWACVGCCLMQILHATSLGREFFKAHPIPGLLAWLVCFVPVPVLWVKNAITRRRAKRYEELLPAQKQRVEAFAQTYLAEMDADFKLAAFEALCAEQLQAEQAGKVLEKATAEAPRSAPRRRL